MDNYLIWLIAGFLLVIVELASGTFYLLVLGVAAFAGAAAAYAGLAVAAQTMVAAVLAVAGVVWVNRARRTSATEKMASLDVGQPTALDAWVDRASGRARVRYRGTLWDATVVGDVAGEPGENFYIVSIDGNTLRVSKTRPA